MEENLHTTKRFEGCDKSERKAFSSWSPKWTLRGLKRGRRRSSVLLVPSAFISPNNGLTGVLDANLSRLTRLQNAIIQF